MNSPLLSDPGLADDLLAHDSHVISGRWHEPVKSTPRSIWRWNHSVRGWGVLLQALLTTHCVFCLPRPQGQDRSLPRASLSPESHWTMSAAAGTERHSDLMPFDHSLVSFSMEGTVPSWGCLLFQVMQQSINSISVNFLSCSNILLRTELVSTLPAELSPYCPVALHGAGLISTVLLQHHLPPFPTFLPCICSDPCIISKMILYLYFCTFCPFLRISIHFWKLTAILRKHFQILSNSTLLFLSYSFQHILV